MPVFGFDSIKDMFDGGGRGASRSSNAGSSSRSDETREERRERRREANREASARYAVQAYRDEGTPIPGHLRDVVDAQIARGDYASRTADRGSRRGNLLDLFLGPAPGSTASILGTPRPAPTPGPDYYAGLGAPGIARDDSFVASVAPATPATPAASAVVDPALVSTDAVAMAPPPLPAPTMAGVSDISVAPQSMFTFEDYLAQLRGVPQFAPPVVQPIAMNQGIMSLPSAGLLG